MDSRGGMGKGPAMGEFGNEREGGRDLHLLITGGASFLPGFQPGANRPWKGGINVHIPSPTDPFTGGRLVLSDPFHVQRPPLS